MYLTHNQIHKYLIIEIDPLKLIWSLQEMILPKNSK